MCKHVYQLNIFLACLLPLLPFRLLACLSSTLMGMERRGFRLSKYNSVLLVVSSASLLPTHTYICKLLANSFHMVTLQFKELNK